MTTTTTTKSLQKLVENYWLTGQGKNILLHKISLIAYYYPWHKWHKGDDTCSEFYLYSFPALEKILQQFQPDKGISFDCYLHFQLKWQLQMFFRAKKQQNKQREYLKMHEFWDFPEYESLTEPPEEPERNFELQKIFEVNEQNRILRNSEKKQFLFFILKKAQTLSPANLEYIAAVTGYSMEWLLAIADKLNLYLEKKLLKLQTTQKKKSTAFIKIRILEDKLLDQQDSYKKQVLNSRLLKERLLYARACQTIARIRLMPSHSAIANITGVPKSTVDSAVYNFKKKAARVYLN